MFHEKMLIVSIVVLVVIFSIFIFLSLLEMVIIEINLQLPVGKLPIYRDYSDPLVDTWIVFSPMDYRNYSGKGLCFFWATKERIYKMFS